VVVSAVEQGGILSNMLGADGDGAELLAIPAGGSREPATQETIKNRRHYIKMNGNEVFKFAVRVIEEATRDVIVKANLTLQDVDFIIPHQANIRIIDASLKRLKYPKEKVVVNLKNYGNMSAASIPVALDEAYRGGRIKKGHKIVLVGFGAGLTWGANLLEWTLN
jgi:3-oxoacyl-[acyl-carrier-protein] synthase-3